MTIRLIKVLLIEEEEYVMIFYLIGTMGLVILLVGFITALVKSVKSGTFCREMKKQGSLFYIGVVPLVILALVALAMAASGEILYMAGAILLMFIYGMAVTCIAEVKKRKIH